MKDQEKMTAEQFTMLAIDKLANKDRKTIHNVYSGFNEAFREYFPGGDPVKEIDALAKAGKISFRLCRGGAIIAKPGVIGNKSASKDALKKMGL